MGDEGQPEDKTPTGQGEQPSSPTATPDYVTRSELEILGQKFEAQNGATVSELKKISEKLDKSMAEPHIVPAPQPAPPVQTQQEPVPDIPYEKPRVRFR